MFAITNVNNIPCIEKKSPTYFLREHILMPESLAFEEDAIWEESVNIRTKTHKPTHSLLNAITISTSDINITI